MTTRPPGAEHQSIVPPERRGYPVEHLRIGECIFSRRAALITTVLGSCVSATFYHPKTGTAAIFHAMLPECCLARDNERNCRYADVSVDEIMLRFKKLGIPAASLTVHLFGGGFTIEPERKRAVRDIVDVGRKNVEAARKALARHGLTIKAEDVLGRHGRKINFLTATGELWVRTLSKEAGDLDPALF